MALSMSDQYLYSYLRVSFIFVCQIHNCAGNSVRQFIRMAGIYFFYHKGFLHFF